jgi:glycosyltransferase involved in cell wall biosynthesis
MTRPELLTRPGLLTRSEFVRPAVLPALAQRLSAVAQVLATTRPEAEPAPERTGAHSRDASILLDWVVNRVSAEPTRERMWLLLVALSGDYPSTEMVQDGIRHFELSTVTESTIWTMDQCFDVVHASRNGGREIELVNGGVVIDVDHTARNDLHTGIQQVIRSTMPHWAREHDITFAAWTDGGAALCPLSTTELARVIEWSGPREVAVAEPVARPGGAGEPDRIIVPWRSVVVLPDVSMADALDPLIGLARCTTNRLVAIGYDCIPAISADMVPVGGANRFIRYLSAAKYMRRIAAISESAAVEFQGFVDALPTQGLIGPVVVECELPAGRPADAVTPHAIGGRPSVLAVGSFEPRKNHLALLNAAETLWREGLDFELELIGGMGWGTDVPSLVADLQAKGRPVHMRYRVGQAELDAAYRRARFTVFASLHEGYGLPVAESMAAGVPSITADFGSTAEIARAGGVVTIDPHDDDALISAMRDLLTDDERVAELRREIVSRPAREWVDYAAQLWDRAVVPELAALGEGGTA